MKTGRPVRNPPTKPMVCVGTLAAELGLSDRAAILVLNHLGVTAVKSSYDAVSSGVAEQVRRFETTGGLQRMRERLSTLSDASRDRPLTASEFDELLTLAAALATVDPRHLAPMLREIPRPATPPPQFSSQEIPVVEVPVATSTSAAVVFSSPSAPTPPDGAHPAPQRPAAAQATPAPVAPRIPPAARAPAPATASPFPRRTCNLCRVDFYSDAPSHGCAGDRRLRERAAVLLAALRGVEDKPVRRPSEVPVDEDRPRRGGWIVSGGHPGSGRRHR